MDEKEEIRRLLAARSEQRPGPEYWEGFLEDLRERQRREVLSLTSQRLLRERTATWWTTRWAAPWKKPWLISGTAGLTVSLLVLAFWMAWNGSPETSGGRQTAQEAPYDSIGLGGFQGWEGEETALNLMEPTLVEIGWTGTSGNRWTPGFEVADGMFVSVASGARLNELVQVRASRGEEAAQIVMVDEGSGLVVIDARGRSR